MTREENKNARTKVAIEKQLHQSRYQNESFEIP